ncbi:drug resistance transporter, EmrB/QacA subfamily [Nocardioides terrae]|uniref:Drug resistance transporter, EmrB/QacA subfamily n=1 Tax=Nocardioides terrae TaxID=574651 RepID=A0A1I1ERA3_9ACTN|nr:MDR family MFS transporter [Nocardioides terrae]SFB87413.1 drug resistance transporter, EmrB/QacA subfamily [Nocardioides terrae]
MTSTVEQAPDKLDPHVLRTAMAVIVGGIAVIFDTTIVSVALHELGTDLHAGVNAIQWISTGYLLAMFVAIPVAGWAQQRFGGKRLWLAALTLFLLGSVLCSFAWDVGSLIAFRVVQGLGGGVMMPLMITMIMQAAHGQNLGRLMAAVSLPTALGPILGPVVGGVILHWGDWRWLFLVNVPLCLVGLFAAYRVLEPDGPVRRVRLDWVGLLLISPAVVGIIYGLSNVADGGFGQASVLAPAVAGAALLLAFLAWAVRRQGDALVDVRLFSHRPLAASSALMFLAGAVLYGAMLLLPLYYQQLRGGTALAAGLLLIPQGVGALVSRTTAGRLTDQVGPRWVAVAGFLVVAAATVPFAFSDASTSYWLLGAALFVRGLGMGAVMVPMMGAAYVGLERAEVPHASIITRVAQQLGGSFGVALLAVILQHATSGLGPAAGFDRAFWWASGFGVLAAALALMLPGRTSASAQG